MALSLPTNFEADIESRNTALVPVVRFTDANGNRYNFISTSLIKKGSYTWKPILLSVPSINESIDVEKRNHKISSVTLQISNLPYDGERFSEVIDANYGSFINSLCKIYWSSPTARNLYTGANPSIDSSALQVFSGIVRRYNLTDETISVTVEDNSQASLHKDLPLENTSVNENWLDGANVPDKYKNKPIPMVYGDVDNSPLVMSNGLDETEFGTLESGDATLISDSDNLVAWKIPPYQEPRKILKIYDQNYMRIQEFAHYDNKFDTFAGYKELTRQYTVPYGNKLVLNSSEGDDNIISKNELIAIQNYSKEDLIFEKVVRESDYYSSPLRRGWFAGSCNRGTGHVLVEGTLIYEGLAADDYEKWNGTYANPGTALEEEEWYGFIYGEESGQDDWLERKMVGVKIKIPNPTTYEVQKSIVSTYADIYIMNLSMLDGSTSGYLKTNFRNGGNFVDGGSFDEDQTLIEDHLGTQTPVKVDAYNRSVAVDDSTSEFLFYSQAESKANYAISMAISRYDIAKYSLVTEMSDQDFYADVYGRRFDGGTGYESYMDSRSGKNVAPRIIQTIVNQELGMNFDAPTAVESEYNAVGGTYWDIKHSFTINEKINSKKLIENICGTTPLISRFNIAGNFELQIIPHDGGTSIKEIAQDDVIDFSFSRTPEEDVYNACEIKYKWDYAIGEFSETTNTASIEGVNEGKPLGRPYNHNDLSVKGILNGYDSNGYYGINGLKTLTIDDDRGKYIRDKNSAESMALWLLTWHLNQHLILKVKLPLKYLFLEVSDVINFDSLLGGIKPYGINYATTGQRLNGQDIYPNFIITSTSKTLEYIEITCMQLHDLYFDPAFGLKIGCTDKMACNYDELASYNTGTCEYPQWMCLNGDESQDFIYACPHGSDITLELQSAGVAVAGNSNYTTECVDCPQGYDCNGNCGGGAQTNACGECGGDPVTYQECNVKIYYTGGNIASVSFNVVGTNVISVSGGAMAEYGFNHYIIDNRVTMVFDADSVDPIGYGNKSVLCELVLDDYTAYNIEDVVVGGSDNNEIPTTLSQGNHIILAGYCTNYGDVNNDGNVNSTDLTELANCILNNNCEEILQSPCAGDMNADGSFSELDLVALANCVAQENCDDHVPAWVSENVVYGCTDINACNYSPNATIDNGTCIEPSLPCPPNCDLPMGTLVCHPSDCGCDSDSEEGTAG